MPQRPDTDSDAGSGNAKSVAVQCSNTANLLVDIFKFLLRIVGKRALDNVTNSVNQGMDRT